MRSSNVRRIKHKRQAVVAMAVVAIATMLVSIVAFAKAPATEGPSKVAICHFDGHEYGSVYFTGTIDGVPGVALDGDYVIHYGANGPTPTFCNSYGGEMIIVSVNALNGHRAQLQERVFTSGYPDGWKG